MGKFSILVVVEGSIPLTSYNFLMNIKREGKSFSKDGEYKKANLLNAKINTLWRFIMARKKNVIIGDEPKAPVPVVSSVSEGSSDEISAEKAAGIAKRAATNAAKKEAKVKLAVFLKENEDFELASELKLLIVSSVRVGKPRGENINDKLKAFLVEAGSEGVSEMDIFKAYKIGQPEMSIKTRLFLKVEPASNRIWVQFFPDEEIYKIIATGADMPSDWEGYVPADQVSL